MLDLENGRYYGLGGKTLLLSIIQRGGLVFVVYLIIITLTGFASPMITSTLGPSLSSFLGFATGAITIFVLVMELFIIGAALLEYSVSKVMLDEGSLKIVRGILSKEEVSLPYRRIQSVEIKQTLLQRILGVGHLVISTTTDLEQPSGRENEDDDEVIPLMDYPLAAAVSQALTDRAETEKMQIQK
jgi:uncharacterized membrane protein YdbT with pleckstrin-like domain